MKLEATGRTVNATTGGRAVAGDQPLVVFLHGAGAGRTAWVLQTRYFAAHGWSVLAVDYPGHGWSNGPALESVEDMAGWVVELIGTAGYEIAALVGHSLGSFVALETAGTHPDVVHHLALIGTGEALPVHPALQKAADEDPGKARTMMIDWGLSNPSHKGGHPTPGYWMLGSGRQMMALSSETALAVDLRASHNYTDALVAAGRVSCPTLVVIGESDRMVLPESGFALADAIPGSKVVVIGGVGHYVVMEDPEATLNAVAGFLGPM